jgi:succinate dehydrogenase / fumarate reductase iron-sulfur subunit
MNPGQKIRFKIQRRENPSTPPRWEEFEVSYYEGMNVIGALMEVQKNPVTIDGKPTTPPAWEANCLEEVCGSCTMVINGKVRQACSALVVNLSQPIELRPMSKFPNLRDLKVDRSRMFEGLKKVGAWVSLDGTHALGAGPRVSPETQQKAYALSRCMTCGCCLEACPQYNEHSQFVGAAAISQVRLFNLHPSGAMNAGERLEALMGPGGVSGCGNAQNCVKACPKDIPLTTSIGEVEWQVTKHAIKKIFGV